MGLPARRCGEFHSALSCRACVLTDEVERLRKMLRSLAFAPGNDLDAALRNSVKAALGEGE